RRAAAGWRRSTASAAAGRPAPKMRTARSLRSARAGPRPRARSRAWWARRGVVDAPPDIEPRRRALLSELATAESARQAAADKLQEAENRQVELDKGATAAIQLLPESRETAVRAEERLAAADDRRKEVEARIHEALNSPPH